MSFFLKCVHAAVHEAAATLAVYNEQITPAAEKRLECPKN